MTKQEKRAIKKDYVLTKKYEFIVKYFKGCKFSEDDAIKEVENIIRYNTTGVDAVSRNYAIKLIYADLFGDAIISCEI